MDSNGIPKKLVKDMAGLLRGTGATVGCISCGERREPAAVVMVGTKRGWACAECAKKAEASPAVG